MTWNSNPNCGIARERETKKKKKRERERQRQRTIPWTALTWGTARPTHRTKDWANTRGELIGCGPDHLPPETSRRGLGGQPEPETGNFCPRAVSSTKLQAGSIANLEFLGFWMVDICREGCSQRSAQQKRHMAHLRRRARCTPRKPMTGMRKKIRRTATWRWMRSQSIWSRELLRPGKGRIRRSNGVCVLVEYSRPWTWAA